MLLYSDVCPRVCLCVCLSAQNLHLYRAIYGLSLTYGSFHLRVPRSGEWGVWRWSTPRPSRLEGRVSTGTVKRVSFVKC